MMDLARFLLPFVAPLPVIAILILAGLGFFVFKRRKLGVTLIGAAFVVLVLAGYGFFTRAELDRLELSHAPLMLQAISPDLKKSIRYVMILGSGHVSDHRLPVTAQINADSLFRLVEGIRIHKALPDSRLLISGGPLPGDPVPNAEVVSALAREIGVAEVDDVFGRLHRLGQKPLSADEMDAVIRNRMEERFG